MSFAVSYSFPAADQVLRVLRSIVVHGLLLVLMSFAVRYHTLAQLIETVRPGLCLRSAGGRPQAWRCDN